MLTSECLDTPLADEDEILTYAEVCKKTRLSRHTIWRLRCQSLFPAPRRVGKKQLVWYRREIAEYLANAERA